MNDSINIPGIVHLHLTRRNLLTLLRKLDRAALGEETRRTILKQDTTRDEHPLTGCKQCIVTAHEDEAYYTDRTPGHTKEFPHA